MNKQIDIDMYKQIKSIVITVPRSKCCRIESDVSDDVNRVLSPLKANDYCIFAPIKQNLLKGENEQVDKWIDRLDRQIDRQIDI